MRKICVILSTLLILSLLNGCSTNNTEHNESVNNIQSLDDPDSIVENPISDITTTSINASNNNTNSTDAATTTTISRTESNKTNTTTNTSTETKLKKTNTTTNRPTASTKKPTSSTASTTTSTAITTKSTSSTAKDYGTPNINGTFHDDMATSVLDILNEARREANLNELTMDNGNMMKAAKIRAKEITTCWDHKRPDGDNWDTVFEEKEVKYNARGENLAYGHTSAQMVFDGWMASKDHKENMLKSYYTHVSIVCLEYNNQFYWVQLFGANITH